MGQLLVSQRAAADAVIAWSCNKIMTAASLQAILWLLSLTADAYLGCNGMTCKIGSVSKQAKCIKNMRVGSHADLCSRGEVGRHLCSSRHARPCARQCPLAPHQSALEIPLCHCDARTQWSCCVVSPSRAGLLLLEAATAAPPCRSETKLQGH